MRRNNSLSLIRHSSSKVGCIQEERARRYLETEGLRLLARNFRGFSGEIDLILCNDQCLVFVEVRYRRTERFGSAAETITRAKQRRIVDTARYYLQQYPTELACRFDVVAINGQNGIEWLQDAFRDE